MQVAKVAMRLGKIRIERQRAFDQCQRIGPIAPLCMNQPEQMPGPRLIGCALHHLVIAPRRTGQVTRAMTREPCVQ